MAHGTQGLQGGGTDGDGKGEGGDPPPKTRAAGLGKLGGGLGTQETGRGLATPPAAASEAGGTPPVNPEQPYATAPPPLPVGAEGGIRQTLQRSPLTLPR